MSRANGNHYAGPHATRAMRSRVIALEHESRRLAKVGELCGPRANRIGALLRKAYLAEEGRVIRTKIRNYGNWVNPIRDDRGPRVAS
jgi:hypothetical protein